MKALLGAIPLCLAVAGCSLSTLGPVVDQTAGEAQAAAAGRWEVQVSAESTNAPGLSVVAGPVRESQERESGAWFEHDIVFENVGETTIRLFNPRAAIGLLRTADGEPRLIASGGWCGYRSIRQAERGVGICILPAETVLLRPGESHVLALAVSRQLRGLQPVVAGSYALDLRFAVKRNRPSSRLGEQATVGVAYRFERV